MSALRQVCILGSTGSIGQSTLDVIARHPDRFMVRSLSCGSRWQDLLQQCRRWMPVYAAVGDAAAGQQLRSALRAEGIATEVLIGESGLEHIAADPGADTVMAAIVGAVGLAPTVAAARAGKRLLLANKESLVMAGSFFMAAVREGGAELLPIDSEHNAIFQCLPGGYRTGDTPRGVRRLLLTASGGPFRSVPLESLDAVTPEQAVAHPNWVMGRKISVDSATMMNKGLEMIEACWLFGLSVDKVEVLIHPQSVIHSLVEYVDGSALAQLGSPDMRVPIACAMAWPERIASGAPVLDLVAAANLGFEAPDLRRFPCLALAMQAARDGASLPIALNAANEVAVEAFLDGRIRYTAIPRVIAEVLGSHRAGEPESMEHVKAIDGDARISARASLGRC
jgi:1-deoxy-D-xylulose-5-phosphate reductoisomerase